MRKYIGFIIALVAISVVSGCGKKSEIVSAELSQALSETVAFSEQLTEIDTQNAEKRYSLNSKDYNEIAAFVGTLSTCDEYVIIKTDTPDSVSSKLKSYVADKKEAYEKYRPNEVYKLDNAVIQTHNDAVVMVISNDSENALNVYNEYLKN